MNGDREEPAQTIRSQRRDSTNISVSVECPADPRIAEILYDGREIPRPPVSKGEKQYTNARKIDFWKEDTRDGTYDEFVSVGVQDAREKENRQLRGRPDPSAVVSGLEAVRTKLRSAYSELGVLHDIMTLSKDRKYTRFEPVAPDPIEYKPYFNFHYKKQAAFGAHRLLQNAAERLRKSLSEAAQKAEKGDNDYHVALAKLRDHWRLKKSGQHVSGDLSYRTAGSSIKGAGQFEIRKTEDNDEKPVEVIIAGDLVGESCIQIDLIAPDLPTPTKDYCHELKTRDIWLKIVTLDNPWNRALTSAQNSLFCREIIMLLSAEAISLRNTALSPIVFSDQIHYTSLQGFSVQVKLVQVQPSEIKISRTEPKNAFKFSSRNTLAESAVLERTMALVLLKRMRDLVDPDIPIPACGPLGLTMFRRKMATQARDRRVMKQSAPKSSMTSELLDRATALLIKKRCLWLADEVCGSDLQVTVHDCSFSTSWKNANVKMTLVTPGYDMYHRTYCAFNILHGQVNFVTRDYVVPITVSCTFDCHLLYIEIVRHYAVVLQVLLKNLRFEVIHYMPNYDYYQAVNGSCSEAVSVGASFAIVITARSFDNKWLVKVICSLRYVFRLYLTNLDLKTAPTGAVRDESFLAADRSFKEVDLNAISGEETHLRRVALVLGCLGDLSAGHPLLSSTSHQQIEIRRKNDTWSKRG